MKLEWNYQEAADYIEELPKFTKKNPLEHTKDFVRRLGGPAGDRKVIHVAGTNGKGSVCAYIQAILLAEGKTCGFFTSPHLIKVNERIRINNVQITDEEFLKVFEEVYAAAKVMEEEGFSHPSYFEFLYGMGMCAFDKSDAEYIILETGLGGRLDATNSFAAPVLTVITSISLDHTAILGGTIEKIAAEKAGIIKQNVPVIFDGSDEQASAVIRKTAEKRQAPCREISKNAYEIQEVTRKSIAFSKGSAYDKDVTWTIPLCGIYQVMNAGIAIAAAEYLLRGENVHLASWKEALASIQWEGRMEEAAPHLTVDGAHNPGAVEAFADSLAVLYPEGMTAPVIIFSAAADKDYERMISCLCRRIAAKVYIVTEIEDERRVPAEMLEQTFKKYTEHQVVCKKEIKSALEFAWQCRGDAEIYCLGSLYLAGAVKKLLTGGGNHA